MTVDPEQLDRDVVNTFRAEVSLWRPSRVPDMVELTERLANSWRRPVALASATGAFALALLLLVSLVVVALVPEHTGWAGVVKDHLIHMP